MKTKLLKTALLTSLFSASILSRAIAAETVTVSGSTTVLPIMQKISESYMREDPNVAIELSGGGSGSGIKGLSDGLTQVAMSSRKIKPEESKIAEKNKVQPHQTTVAIDAIVPIVHPNNKVPNISLDDLRKIYKGEIKNWKEIGGANAPIVLVSRDTSSGTYETWEELVMKKQRISPRALLQSSNGTVVQTVSKNPNAIGYIGFGYITPSIKAVNVNGIKATSEAAADGKWPLSRELYLYTNGAPKGAVEKVISYTLAPKGQKLIKETGFIPLK